MPRKFLSSILPQRHHVSREWYLRPLAALLHDPALWAIHRKAVARAVALGLAVALLPIPGHTVLAAFAAVFLRVNLPVTLVAVFFTNPITMVPVFLFAYRLGAGVLGVELQPFTIDISVQWVVSELARYWQPLLVGCALVGAVLSAVGYLTVNVLWRIAITIKYRRRRQDRSASRDPAAKDVRP